MTTADEDKEFHRKVIEEMGERITPKDWEKVKSEHFVSEYSNEPDDDERQDTVSRAAEFLIKEIYFPREAMDTSARRPRSRRSKSSEDEKKLFWQANKTPGLWEFRKRHLAKGLPVAPEDVSVLIKEWVKKSGFSDPTFLFDTNMYQENPKWGRIHKKFTPKMKKSNTELYELFILLWSLVERMPWSCAGAMAFVLMGWIPFSDRIRHRFDDEFPHKVYVVLDGPVTELEVRKLWRTVQIEKKGNFPGLTEKRSALLKFLLDRKEIPRGVQHSQWNKTKKVINRGWTYKYDSFCRAVAQIARKYPEHRDALAAWKGDYYT